MNSGKRVVASLLVLVVLVGLAFAPQAQATQGHWRDITPTQYTGVPTLQLNSVYMTNGGTGGIGAGDGWAVGNNGAIFRWDGFAWRNQSAGTSCNLNSVHFGQPGSVPLNEFNPSAGMAVGGCGGGTNGQIVLFWNGNSWVNVTGPGPGPLSSTTGNLTSVFVYSMDGSSVKGLVVGYNGTAGDSYAFTGSYTGISGGVLTGLSYGWGHLTFPGGISSSCAINTVSVVSANPLEAWAAGYCGRIYHYASGGWTLYTTIPGLPNLLSIFMVSSSEGWVVGSGGGVYHYTGGTWNNPVACGTASTLRGISFTSSSEGWAVGDSATLTHFTSSGCSTLTSGVPTLKGLRGVHGTGGSNVWAVGETGTIILYDGSLWGSITAPLQLNYNSVWMTGSNDGLAVGNKTGSMLTANIVHWDGVKWTIVPFGSSAVNLYGVWQLNSGEAWVVGGGPTPGTFPTIYHLLGGPPNFGSSVNVAPAPVCPGGTNCILRDLFGLSSDNVWAVGDAGLFAHWDNTHTFTTYQSSPTLTTIWKSVTFVSGDANNGWAVGFDPAVPNPLIYQYNPPTLGPNWQSVPVPAGVGGSVRLNSVQFLDSSHGWIAGSQGIILFWDGIQWNKVNTPSSAYNLTSIFVDSTSDGWAVGSNTGTGKPVFLHWDGFAWDDQSPVNFPTSGTLQSLFLPPTTNGYNGFAVGTAPSGPALALMFHLDPPGGSPPPPTTTTSTVITTSTSIVSSSTSSTTSSMTSSSTSTSSSQTSSSTSQTSSSSTTSQSTSSTSSTVSTSVSTVTVTTSSSSSATTPLVVPAVPGFPWESIAAGIIIGLSVLVVLRRRRNSATT